MSRAPARPAARRTASGLPPRPPPLGAPEPFAFPLPVTVPLGRGLQALHLEDHRLPLVNLRVVMRAGAAADPARAPGAAYACSELLDEGAGKRNGLELAADLRQIGASLSLWVDSDGSYLALQVLRQHLDRALDLATDLLLRPRLAADDWRRVKDDLRDRALARRSQPGDQARLGLKALVYGPHPYGRALLPLAREVEQLTLPDVRAYHRAHYRRDRALVVVAGDVSAREVERKLGARFASWARGQREDNGQRPAAPRPQRRLGICDRPGAPQSVIQVGHLGPARSEVEYAPLRVMNLILGGSFTSRLNLNLRERHGYTYGVHSSFALPRDAGLFGVKTSVATEDTVAALREILVELRGMQAAPVTAAELAKAQQLVIEGLPAEAETLEGLVDGYSTLGLYGLPLETLARLPEQALAVDAAAVQRMARRVLFPERPTVIVVGDRARLEAPLRALCGPARLLDEDGQPV